MSSAAKRQRAVDGEASSTGTSDAAAAQEEEEQELSAALRGVPPAWAADIGKVLFTEAQLQRRVAELGAEISASYRPGDEVVVVGLLTGAVVFMTDLVRRLTVPYVLDFMVASSYRGTHSTGTVELKKDMAMDPTNRHILVVEDIVDSGATLAWLRQYLVTKKCASVKVACLLDKKVGRLQSHADVVVDFVGFTCPDAFVVGYGLDFNQRYRGLPFVGVLKPAAYGASGE